MMDLPPPLPPRVDPPPLPESFQPYSPDRPPEKKRGPGIPIVWLFILAGLLGLYHGPLSTKLTFIDDRGRVPADFQATLRRGKSEKVVTVEGGRLKVLRGRWQEVEVTDTSYIGSTYPIDSGTISIERNTSRKLKDAARGSSSVRQRGDPDPSTDR